MRLMKTKTIGIVGGAGPMASALLYTSIIEVCQKNYNASDYSDFPEIILVSHPFLREKIKEELALCFAKLKLTKADLFSIASVSFHGFLPENLPGGFVNLITESLKEAAHLHLSKAVILASQKTIDLKLFEHPNLTCFYPSPENQNIINQLIWEVAEGKVNENQSHALRNIIGHMHRHSSVEGIILACTELPLIHRKRRLFDELPVIDTIEVLAKSLEG